MTSRPLATDPVATSPARTRRARARGVCPGCGRPVDLVCHTCQSAVCRQCGGLTGSLYARTCEPCQAGGSHHAAP
jgi:hypothetical protein